MNETLFKELVSYGIVLSVFFLIYSGMAGKTKLFRVSLSLATLFAFLVSWIMYGFVVSAVLIIVVFSIFPLLMSLIIFMVAGINDGNGDNVVTGTISDEYKKMFERIGFKKKTILTE